MTVRTKYILGVKINLGLTFDIVLQEAAKLITSGASHYICTTNPEFIVAAQGDPEFKAILNSSDLSLADGVGVLYADAFLSKSFRVESSERLPGAVLTDKLCALAEQNNYSIFLLGSRNAEGAATNLLRKYPKLNIVGYSSDFKHDEFDDADTVDYIHRCMKKGKINSIDLLFVAYGQVNQEKWIVRNMQKVQAHLCVGVGGTLDYISGAQKMPDKFFVSHNIEWLYRLLRNPYRLLRMVNAVIIFPIMVIVSSLRNKSY